MRRIFLFNMPTLLLCLFTKTLGYFFPWLLVLGLVVCLPPLVQAQTPSPITSSGLNTVVTQNGTTYNITGGTRPGGGTNLFHSFGDFNVPNNNIANFLNTPVNGVLPSTSNILGRVTGGNISNIFGTIQTTGFGSANLFMMNPAGFLFGPNATLNVGGMVAFTSADYLRLADGVLFNAVPNAAADALLSAAPVAAFGFLGSNPGAITVQGSQFSVTEGTGISLVGGNITVQSGVLDDGITVQPARLSARGGQVNLASVASPGEVLAGTLDYAPNVNGQSFGALSSTNISEQSAIDVSGNGGGTVSIRGGQFVLDNSTISANVTGPGPVVNGVESIGGGIDIQMSQNALIQNGTLIDTSVVGNATPGVTYGSVHIKAEQIEVQGIVDLDTGNFVTTSVQSTVAPGSTGGNSGDIKLEANSILVKDFGQVQTTTDGAGDAGNIFVTANQNLVIDVGIILSSSLLASGNAGNIELTNTHGNILITNAGFVSTQAVRSSGNAGSITVNAREGDVVLSGDDIFGGGIIATLANRGTGALGGIQVTAHNLQLLNGSSIEGFNFLGVNTLKPGNIDVTLSGSLSLDGGSFIETIARGPAPAAALNITALDVSIAGGSSLSTETFSSGPGGQLNISTNNLQLTSGGQLQSGSIINPFPLPGETPEIPSGPGGAINIQGLDGPATSVLIDGAGSGIFTNTVGTGAGGSINLFANSVTLQNGSTLSAATTGTAPSATGGTITVNAEQVALNSQALITADTNGIAPAGVVEINTGSLAINSGSQIRSNSGAETEPLNAFALSSAAPTLTGGTIIVQGPTGDGSLAQSVTIDGARSGIFTESTGNRPGGDINILTSGPVTMTNGSSISASSTGTGPDAGRAGDITINAGGQFAMTNSSVTTEAKQSSGGSIKIATNPSGTVQLTDSTISASVLDGTGGGGSVNIDPQFVLLQNSHIKANAVFGPGGNIFITTNLLLPDATSTISASSQFGRQGTVTIQSPINPASRIIFLSQKPLVATSLLTARCAALAQGNFSSFIVAGRDALPAEPASWLASPLAALGAGEGHTRSAESSVLSAELGWKAGGERREATLREGEGHTRSAESSVLSAELGWKAGGERREATLRADERREAGGEGETQRYEREMRDWRERQGAGSDEPPILSLRQIAPPGFLTQSFAVDWSGCTS